MYKLFIDDDALADLEQLRCTDPGTADEILVLLQELPNDQYLLDALTIDHFGDDKSERIQVRKWGRLWRAGLDLWRVKPWGPVDRGIQIRIFYAYLVTQRHYYVLAIARRKDVDYDDPDHPLTKRILRAYRNLAS